MIIDGDYSISICRYQDTVGLAIDRAVCMMHKWLVTNERLDIVSHQNQTVLIINTKRMMACVKIADMAGLVLGVGLGFTILQ